MILRVGRTEVSERPAMRERRGAAIDARILELSADEILHEIHDPTSDIVACPRPGPVHEGIGVIAPETTVTRRRVLATVARSRGMTSSQDEEIRRIEESLAAIDPPMADIPGALDAVADARRDVDGLRDRVARLGGRVAAEPDPESESDAQAELRATAGRLAEAETAHHAATQELARERDRQREANDARERRLRLQDRLENRRRDAHEELASGESERVRRAQEGLPEWPGATDDARLALAAVRVGQIQAPVVISGGPFRTPMQARAALAAPVVLA